MKYLGVWLAVILHLLFPVSAVALEPLNSSVNEVLIAEVQVRSGSSASEESVELYNNTDRPMDLSKWTLEYKSASSMTWITKASLRGVMAPRSRFLLASTDYLVDIATETFKPGLADSAGHVRLTSPNPTDNEESIVHDLLGWGDGSASSARANEAEGNSPAPKPTNGASLNRKTDEAGYLIDTDNNLADFEVKSEPSPQADPLMTIPIDDTDPYPTSPPNSTPPEDGAPPLDDSPDPPNDSLPTEEFSPPQITELLPNPAVPVADADGEFVELYNPNTEPFDLDGYKLQTGNNYSYSLVFKDQVIDANGYKAFYASETGLVLANSSGRARLVNPEGQVVSETAGYTDARDGETWVWGNVQWQWSTTPTPNSTNIVTHPIATASVAKTKVALAKTAKKTATRTSAKNNGRVSGAKTTRASKDKNTNITSGSENSPEETPTMTKQIAPIHPAILVGVGTAALVYGLYEYRTDIRNRIYEFKRYRAYRREHRQAPAGR